MSNVSNENEIDKKNANLNAEVTSLKMESSSSITSNHDDVNTRRAKKSSMKRILLLKETDDESNQEPNRYKSSSPNKESSNRVVFIDEDSNTALNNMVDANNNNNFTKTTTKVLETSIISSKKKKKEQSKNKQFSYRQSVSKTERADLYIELEEVSLDERELFKDHDDDKSSIRSSTSSNIYEWKILARWIKYEQTIDPETNVWSKPFVGAIIYQNLVYLKNTLQYAYMNLSTCISTFEGIIDEMIRDFIDRGHMNKEHKDSLKAVIISKHRNRLTIAGVLSGKKGSMSDLFSHNRKQSKFSHVENSFSGSNTLLRQLSLSAHNHNSTSNNNSQHKKTNSIDLNEIDEKAKLNPVKTFTTSNQIEANTSDTNLNNQFGHKNLKSTFSMIRHSITHHHHHHPRATRSDVNTLSEIEAFLIMVGVVEFLDRPVMAFVRLDDNYTIEKENLIDSKVKVRFLFIFLGPKKNNIDYYEIGRCMGTLMTNRDFHDVAYSAKNRQDIVRGITTYTNRSLCFMLPLGDFDDDLLAPVIDWIKKKMNDKESKLNRIRMRRTPRNTDDISEKENENISTRRNMRRDTIKRINSSLEYDFKDRLDEEKFDPFRRTGIPFGALANEMCHRYVDYFDDIKDGLNIHCLISFICVFTVCIAPGLCFGGILADKTDRWFGINEMLMATSINGVFFGLFSGQPLMILGATGPFLVFEEMLYNFCKSFCIEYLAARCWVALWVLIFVLIMLATEGVFIIHTVTRFTEEIFAFLIACVFLADAIKKIVYYFAKNPVYTGEKYCEFYSSNKTVIKTASLSFLNQTNSSNYSYLISQNQSVKSLFTRAGCKRLSTIDLVFNDSEYYMKNHPEPNVALISILLLFLTCLIALYLKKIRRSNFFGSIIRRTLSDVGILISIIIMVLVDFLIKFKTEVNTQKLDIPDTLMPTNPSRKSWFVSPLGNNFDSNEALPTWIPIVAIIPAFLIFIVLFFEVELTGIMLSAEHRKLKKGTGFNLDLLICGVLMVFNGFLGLPWMCSAPVRTLAHWASLNVYTSSLIPGEKSKLTHVKEQRVTNILVHLAIGLCLKGKILLRHIPVPVLFGVFLYFGIVSLSGTQLYERIKLLFIPFKYSPNLPYANGIRPTKRNLFTMIQILAVIILLAFKSFISISFFFPIVLVALVPFRRFILTRFFTNRELEQLDEENEQLENDSVHDFYELTHLPI